MTLPRFLVGMFAVVAAVVAWSLMSSVSVGMTALRAILTLVVLQCGYFLVVVLMSIRQRGGPAEQTGSKESNSATGDLDSGHVLNPRKSELPR